MNQQTLEFSVSQFIASFNQTLLATYPKVIITGELANYRISRNKWLYFDLKDTNSSLKFFGTVYNLPGPLEDGMMLKVVGEPRLHHLYGFSINIETIKPVGEGSLKKAAELLKDKLVKEGLFDEERKRKLAYPPSKIGLITAKQSAAYADFIKIISARWTSLTIELIDVQVQGDLAPEQIIAALKQFNSSFDPPEVLVLIRGGGSADDLQAFNNEEVVRNIAFSRIPTLIAIGHETDLSLAELTADKRASTPSNAAELLVPDKVEQLQKLVIIKQNLKSSLDYKLQRLKESLELYQESVQKASLRNLDIFKNNLINKSAIIEAFNPESVLKRGYAIVRKGNHKIVKQVDDLQPDQPIQVQLYDGEFVAQVKSLKNYYVKAKKGIYG